MAAITFDRFEIVHVYGGGQIETQTAASIADRKGKAVMVTPSTGRVEPVNSTDVDIEAPIIVGLCATNAQTSLAVESVTILTHALLDVGQTALSGLNFGAPVFLSNTDYVLDTAAGTNRVIVGTVVPVFRNELGTDKLLLLDTRHLMHPVVFPE